MNIKNKEIKYTVSRIAAATVLAISRIALKGVERFAFAGPSTGYEQVQNLPWLPMPSSRVCLNTELRVVSMSTPSVPDGTFVKVDFVVQNGQTIVFNTGGLQFAGREFSTVSGQNIHAAFESKGGDTGYSVKVPKGGFNVLVDQNAAFEKSLHKGFTELAKEDINQGKGSSYLLAYNSRSGDLTGVKVDNSRYLADNSTNVPCPKVTTKFIPSVGDFAKDIISAPVVDTKLVVPAFRPANGPVGRFEPDVSKDLFPSGEKGSVVRLNEVANKDTLVLMQLPWIMIKDGSKVLERGYNNNGQVLLALGPGVELDSVDNGENDFTVDTLAGYGVRTQGFFGPDSTANRDEAFKKWIRETSGYIKRTDTFTLYYIYMENGQKKIETIDVNPYQFAQLP